MFFLGAEKPGGIFFFNKKNLCSATYWRYYVSEWEDYKRATGIKGQDVLDELWSCMTADLKRLAFDQGGKETLNTEALMMARIRQLAVSVLHSVVHTVSPRVKASP